MTGAHSSLGPIRYAIFGCIVFWMLLASIAAWAEPGGDSAQGVSRAEVIRPLSVEAVNDLDFGGIAVTPLAGGTVRIDPLTGKSFFTGAAAKICVSAAGCDGKAAKFNVSGEVGRSYVIELPATVYAQSTLATGPALLVTDLVTNSVNQPGRPSRGQLDSDGSDVLMLGGTLHIPAGTEAGRYSAAVRLVVTYS